MNLHSVKNDGKASVSPSAAVGAHLPPLIELRGVEKSFPGRAQPVLTRLSFSITEGEFAVIVGGSGAGKTTLISLLAGLLTPDRGAILFAGKPLSGPGPERAVVFQNYSLLPWLTVLGNVSLAVTAASPQFNRRTVYDHAQYFIELVNLSAAINKRPRELSGGMRQRVALARALAMEPRLLLLDEPLSALDALTRATLQDELARICSETKTTVIMVTNDIDEAILLADCVYPLTRGPAATLGHPITSTLPRPRSRHGISLIPAYQEARQHLVTFLEQSKKARTIIKIEPSTPGFRIATSSSQTASSPPLASRMPSL